FEFRLGAWLEAIGPLGSPEPFLKGSGTAANSERPGSSLSRVVLTLRCERISCSVSSSKGAPQLFPLVF
ncbi:MAG: hypothetical protein LBD17_02180, partial [Endomicrobium sp.]|nr:hypothetical protein [Endomicrobium sp.]